MCATALAAAGLRTAAFGAAVLRTAAAFLEAVLVDAALAAGSFEVAVLEVVELEAAAFDVGRLDARLLGAAFAVAFTAAVRLVGGAVRTLGSDEASATTPGRADPERTFDQLRSPRSARLP